MNDAAWVTRHRPVILCVGMGIIAAWYVVLLGAYLLVPSLKDAIRARATDMLRGEFASDVQFQSFEVSFLPRVHVIARGLLIGDDSAGPLIQAATAEAQSDVLPWHIRTLALQGLSLHIPSMRRPNVTRTSPALTMTIDEIVSEHAQVEILPSDSRQTPLHFELARFRLTNFNPSRTADFSAFVISSEPLADIQASGHVGPWNAPDPSLTPLQGTYIMPRSDLAIVPSLKGFFSSKGQFRGVLQRIEIAGDVDASEFSLSLSGRPQPWRATFQASVDAWDGSASIEQLQGVLQRSSFVASGFVRNIQDDRLRDISLDLSVTQGRLEDILPLAVKSKTPPVRGALRARGKLEILPGDQNIINRLRLDADFAANRARFSSDLGKRLRTVSRRATRHSKKKMYVGSVSSMQGHLRLDNGRAEFSSLAFRLPGSSGRLKGSYERSYELASEHLEATAGAGSRAHTVLFSH